MKILFAGALALIAGFAVTWFASQQYTTKKINNALVIQSAPHSFTDPVKIEAEVANEAQYAKEYIGLTKLVLKEHENKWSLGGSISNHGNRIVDRVTLKIDYLDKSAQGCSEDTVTVGDHVQPHTDQDVSAPLNPKSCWNEVDFIIEAPTLVFGK